MRRLLVMLGALLLVLLMGYSAGAVSASAAGTAPEGAGGARWVNVVLLAVVVAGVGYVWRRFQRRLGRKGAKR